MAKQLTPKQSMFCAEYLIDLNGAGAARRAGYSAKTADQIAIELLGKTLVQAQIQRLMDARAKAVRMDAQALLSRLVDEAEADVADLYEPDGRLKPVHQWPLIWRKGLVGGIEIESLDDGGVVTKVKLSDRIKRLELIGKHVGVGAFREKIEHSVADPLADLLREISGRAVAPKG